MTSPSSLSTTDRLPAADAVDVARRIGRRLCDSAVPAGDGRCTWLVRVPGEQVPGDPAPEKGGEGRRSTEQQASGLLYQGTAGIAWFLGELTAVDGDARCEERARAGLDFALDFARGLPLDSWGFHSGRVGIAWVAARLGERLDDPRLVDEAFALLEPMAGHERRDRSLDVIGGAAGAIPALLDLRRLADEPKRDALLLAQAEALAEHLCDAAHREPTGWSWPTVPRSSVRNLLGLAHGTAGIAVALLEAAKACGRGDFRFAAHMARLYENRFRRGDDWPDLRNVPLGELLRRLPEGRLRALARDGALPPFRPTPMWAWCHGSPGIGLARLRAFELTGETTYLDDLRGALRSTAASLDPEALAVGNFSLCHGGAGNAELHLVASRVLDEPELGLVAAATARLGRETVELAEAPWPCGTYDAATDPSLMLGEAGIGLFYLRLARPEIPCPLLLRPDHGEAAPSEASWAEASRPQKGWAETARESVRYFFADTLDRWAALGTSVDELMPSFEPGAASAETSTPAETTYRHLVEKADELSSLHRDAFAVDRARFEGAATLEDLTAQTLRELARPPWEELVEDLDRVRFRLPEGSIPVWTERDWSRPAEQPGDGPPAGPALVLLTLTDHRLVPTFPAPLPTVILAALDGPRPLQELEARVQEALGGSADGDRVRQVVRGQVEQLYRAGLVDATVKASVDATAESEAP